jgi:hypothetical protein
LSEKSLAKHLIVKAAEDLAASQQQPLLPGEAMLGGRA